jgi:hypothetical protein
MIGLMDDKSGETWTEALVVELKYYPSILLEGLRKIAINLSQHNQHLPNSSPERCRYDAEGGGRGMLCVNIPGIWKY